MSDLEFDRDLLLQAFADQSEEGLTAMEEALIRLESQPADPETLNTIFRVCHTLKGDSASLGFEELAQFAHVLEDVLARLREGSASPTSELVTLLLEAVDALREMVRGALVGRQASSQQHDRLLERIRSHDPTHAADAAEAARDSGEAIDDEPGEAERRHRSQTGTLRVRVDALDRQLSLIGEISIARSRLAQMLESVDAAEASELRDAHGELDVLFTDLQEEVMKVRMVPVGPMFRQHIRTVRDTALARGKRAKLIIEGAEAELDTAVIEHLRDPLTHMIRNAIAHGIETPEQREALGKDPVGQISLRARHDGASIVVEVADDGAGFDRARIQQRVRELGLVDEVDALTDAQLDQFVFAPGFSTVDRPTTTSGRGVGMDVVYRNIEILRGSVTLASEKGRGTTVTIRLPLTLAIIDGFAVGVDDDVYVIPLSSVTECVDLPQDRESQADGSGVLNLRGNPVPYVRLRDALAATGSIPGREVVVVIRHGSEQAAVAVDRLYGQRQAVIKPLGTMFREVPGIAGSTILGNGHVALILDVPALLRRAVGWQQRSASLRSLSASAGAD